MQRQNKLSVASSFVFNVNTDTNIYGSQSHSHHNNAGDRNNLLDLPSRPQIDWSNDNYRPIFEPAIGDQNVTAQLGKSTFLRCRIKQITDETVSSERLLQVSIYLRKDAVDAQSCDASNLSS